MILAKAKYQGIRSVSSRLLSEQRPATGDKNICESAVDDRLPGHPRLQ
jgi:hypothetical protein